MVCNGQLDLATAQEAIAKDWVKAYEKFIDNRAAAFPTTGLYS
jgi:hypothetical protein